LAFDLLTLKVVSESRVTSATYVQILVFLGVSVLKLGPMYATDRRQTEASLNASALWGRRHNNTPTVVYLSAGLLQWLVAVQPENFTEISARHFSSRSHRQTGRFTDSVADPPRRTPHRHRYGTSSASDNDNR